MYTLSAVGNTPHAGLVVVTLPLPDNRATRSFCQAVSRADSGTDQSGSKPPHAVTQYRSAMLRVSRATAVDDCGIDVRRRMDLRGRSNSEANIETENRTERH